MYKTFFMVHFLAQQWSKLDRLEFDKARNTRADGVGSLLVNARVKTQNPFHTRTNGLQ